MEIDRAMEMNAVDPAKCPLCGGDNRCGVSSCGGGEEPCWCGTTEHSFPEKLLQQVPEAAQGKACICQACVTAFHAANFHAAK